MPMSEPAGLLHDNDVIFVRPIEHTPTEETQITPISSSKRRRRHSVLLNDAMATKIALHTAQKYFFFHYYFLCFIKKKNLIFIE